MQNINYLGKKQKHKKHTINSTSSFLMITLASSFCRAAFSAVSLECLSPINDIA